MFKVKEHELKKLVDLCESKVPEFVVPPAPNRKDRILRNQPDDKVENIQMNLIGDWLVNAEAYPFQFQKRDITPEREHDKTYLVWAFKIHNPDLPQNTNPGPYGDFIRATIRSLTPLINMRKWQDNTDKWDIHAAQYAFYLFNNSEYSSYAASVLFLQRGDDTTLLSALYASIKQDYSSLHIDFVGGGLEKYHSIPSLMTAYENYKMTFKNKYPGACQQNVSLFMLYMKNTFNIQVMGLYNAGGKAGCLCYVRSATAAGLLSIPNIRETDISKYIGNNYESQQDISSFIQSKIMSQYTCNDDMTITFITPHLLKTMVQLTICVNHETFIKVAEELFVTRDWERLQLLVKLVDIPQSVQDKMEKVLRSISDLSASDIQHAPYPWNTIIKHILEDRKNTSQEPPLKKSKMRLPTVWPGIDCTTQQMGNDPVLKGCPISGSNGDSDGCRSFCGTQWKEWLPTFISLLTPYFKLGFKSNIPNEGMLVVYKNTSNGYYITDFITKYRVGSAQTNYTNFNDTWTFLNSRLTKLLEHGPITLTLGLTKNAPDQSDMGTIWNYLQEQVYSFRYVASLQKPY